MRLTVLIILLSWIGCIHTLANSEEWKAGDPAYSDFPPLPTTTNGVDSGGTEVSVLSVKLLDGWKNDTESHRKGQAGAHAVKLQQFCKLSGTIFRADKAKTNILTLPSGCRPIADIHMPVGTAGFVTVTSQGTMKLFDSEESKTAMTLHLENVAFPVGAKEGVSKVPLSKHAEGGTGIHYLPVGYSMCILYGTVKLKSAGSGWQHIATLPANCRPHGRTIHMGMCGKKFCRFDVSKDGKVNIYGGKNGDIVSAGGVYFPTTKGHKLHGQAGWEPYGHTYLDPRYILEDNRICVLSGLWKKRLGAGQNIGVLPERCRPCTTHSFSVISGGSRRIVKVTPEGQLVSSGGSTGWVAMDGITFVTEAQIVSNITGTPYYSASLDGVFDRVQSWPTGEWKDMRHQEGRMLLRVDQGAGNFRVVRPKLGGIYQVRFYRNAKQLGPVIATVTKSEGSLMLTNGAEKLGWTVKGSVLVPPKGWMTKSAPLHYSAAIVGRMWNTYAWPDGHYVKMGGRKEMANIHVNQITGELTPSMSGGGGTYEIWFFKNLRKDGPTVATCGSNLAGLTLTPEATAMGWKMDGKTLIPPPQLLVDIRDEFDIGVRLEVGMLWPGYNEAKDWKLAHPYTKERRLKGGVSWERRIKFSHPFATVPTVWMSIKSFALYPKFVERVNVMAKDVGKDGFTLVMQTWGDKKYGPGRVFSTGITWTAMGQDHLLFSRHMTIQKHVAWLAKEVLERRKFYFRMKALVDELSGKTGNGYGKIVAELKKMLLLRRKMHMKMLETRRKAQKAVRECYSVINRLREVEKELMARAAELRRGSEQRIADIKKEIDEMKKNRGKLERLINRLRSYKARQFQYIDQEIDEFKGDMRHVKEKIRDHEDLVMKKLKLVALKQKAVKEDMIQKRLRAQEDAAFGPTAPDGSTIHELKSGQKVSCKCHRRENIPTYVIGDKGKSEMEAADGNSQQGSADVGPITVTPISELQVEEGVSNDDGTYKEYPGPQGGEVFKSDDRICICSGPAPSSLEFTLM